MEEVVSSFLPDPAVEVGLSVVLSRRRVDRHRTRVIFLIRIEPQTLKCRCDVLHLSITIFSPIPANQ